jgi:hypothetical protein
LDRALTESGESLVQLTAASPVLLIFLRHAGCTFCRETLRDVAEARDAIEKGGTRIVLVHMGDREALQTSLHKYGLTLLDRISDPGQELYRAFGLRRGNFRQLAGFTVVWRGLVEGALMKCGIGRVTADSRQLPGIFLIDAKGIIRRFRHRTAADRPDYVRFCAPTES